VEALQGCALAQLGRLDEARTALPTAESPGYVFADIGDVHRWDSYLDSSEFDRFIEGLRRAGLPE
jgi:hypothetical protein